jgi:hypothetical protein
MKKVRKAAKNGEWDDSTVISSVKRKNEVGQHNDRRRV